MNETNVIRRVWDENVLGNINRGRPKKTWEEVVKEDMSRRGLSIEDAQMGENEDVAVRNWSTLASRDEDQNGWR